jgi:acetone carboxylase gamma subunit
MSKAKRTHYAPFVKCSNCRLGDIFEGQSISIPLGTQIRDHLCPQCGCDTLYLA